MKWPADDLPERCRYRDEGCELAPSCLDCPLPNCIEELPRGRQRYLLQRRCQQIACLRSQGKGTREIATFLKVSSRTVQRAVKGKADGRG